MSKGHISLTQKEIYQILGVVGRISMSVESRESVREELGEDIYNSIFISTIADNISNPIVGLYNHFLNNEDYESIRKYFEVTYGFNYDQKITICDLYSKSGNWLEKFKTSMPMDTMGSASVHLIGNEHNKDDYLNLKNNSHIDEAYNEIPSSFYEIPKKSISLMLYNPSYNTNKEFEQGLQKLIDKELIYTSNKKTQKNGRAIMILNGEILRKNSEMLVKNFKINKKTLYSLKGKNKGNYVIYATPRANSLSTNKINSEVTFLNRVITKNPTFKPSMYEIEDFELMEVPYEGMKNSHKVAEEDFYASQSDNDNWKWIRDITEIEESSNEKIKKPTDLKIGEISNIIASGMINGEMSNNGQGTHIVAGGTKNRTRELVSIEEGKNGEKQEVVKRITYSEPYLNILVNNGDQTIIKELTGGENI